MNSSRSYRKFVSALVVLLIGIATSPADSQESIRVAYSSTDTLNSLWTIAADAGFYKKHGLDAEVPSSLRTFRLATLQAAGLPMQRCAAPIP